MDEEEKNQKIERIRKTKKTPLNEKEEELVLRACDFAWEAHKGQMRKSGDPYFAHSCETALRLAGWDLDGTVIAAGLLHDVVEDTKETLGNLEENFGKDVAFLVEGVTKLGHFKYRDKGGGGDEEEGVRVENFRKMILALSEDLRVIFIKFADRLHNMRTLNALLPEKQKRIALETCEIYASLAYRLGMTSLAGEFEDLALPYLHPIDYKWLVDNVPERYEAREKYLKKAKRGVEKTLKKNSVGFLDISFRAKRYSSIRKKLHKVDMDLDRIYDLVALRIIVNTIEDCYGVLGIIHQMWPPMPGRIKDYIALPKPNGYQSLHTTVFCVGGKITEIQIRTKKMHREAESGIAAHWAYEHLKRTKLYHVRSREDLKNTRLYHIRGRQNLSGRKELAWIDQLKEWQNSFSESEEGFLASMKIDFFKERIFTVTPKGDVIDLPEGATPVDFAYHIHSEVGNRCVNAKVNNRIVPLNYKLESGDMIEIRTQKGKKPSEDWLGFVKTSSARDHIRCALREKRKLGRHITDRLRKK